MLSGPQSSDVVKLRQSARWPVDAVRRLPVAAAKWEQSPEAEDYESEHLPLRPPSWELFDFVP